jgi:hypothetical protein
MYIVRRVDTCVWWPDAKLVSHLAVVVAAK